MAERRTLKQGLEATPTVDPAVAREFIYGAKGAKPSPEVEPVAAPRSGRKPKPVRRARLTTRVRADMAAALKRASLERQLQGVQPSAVQEILEEALEPWLRTHGYLS